MVSMLTLTGDRTLSAGAWLVRGLCGPKYTTAQTAHRRPSCWVDYCNSLYFGIGDVFLSHLQSVQNSMARLITGVMGVSTSCQPYISHIVNSHPW